MESENSNRLVLTSWDEVANYLGKSVRTVQRWERALGLPVRRSEIAASKHLVIAYPDELNDWLLSNFRALADTEVRQNRGTELARLQRLTDTVTARSEELQQRMKTLVQSVNAAQKRFGGT